MKNNQNKKALPAQGFNNQSKEPENSSNYAAAAATTPNTKTAKKPEPKNSGQQTTIKLHFTPLAGSTVRKRPHASPTEGDAKRLSDEMTPPPALSQTMDLSEGQAAVTADDIVTDSVTPPVNETDATDKSLMPIDRPSSSTDITSTRSPDRSSMQQTGDAVTVSHQPDSQTTPPTKGPVKNAQGSLTYSGAASVHTQLRLCVSSIDKSAHLDADDLRHIRSEMTNQIRSRGKVSSKPIQIVGTSILNGIIRIDCKNDLSLAWAREAASEIAKQKPYLVYNANDIPPLQKVFVWVPTDVAETPKDFVLLLDLCNTDLDIQKLHQWGVAKNINGQTFIFGAEPEFLDQLKAIGDKPFCGMAQVRFKMGTTKPAGVKQNIQTRISTAPANVVVGTGTATNQTLVANTLNTGPANRGRRRRRNNRSKDHTNRASSASSLGVSRSRSRGSSIVQSVSGSVNTTRTTETLISNAKTTGPVVVADTHNHTGETKEQTRPPDENRAAVSDHLSDESHIPVHKNRYETIFGIELDNALSQ